jgi:glycosyltransferase involved in cell wall biosynthesis
MASGEAGEPFDAYYFAHGCGRPYQRDDEWLSFFRSVAERITSEYKPTSVLDAGCAMGFLVEALRNIGVEAYGVDISLYAIENVHPDIRPYCWVGSVLDPLPRRYDVIVCIEVLEHVSQGDAERALDNFCSHTDQVLFSSTAVDYKEASHYNVRPPEYWAEQFAHRGFFRDVDLDASFITPWAAGFRKASQPVHRIVRDLERIFWLARKENVDLREVAISNRHLLASKDQELAALGQELTALGQELAARGQELAALGAERDVLARKVLEWEMVQRGTGWALLQKLRRWRASLAPPGSRRDRLFCRVLRSIRPATAGTQPHPPERIAPLEGEAEVRSRTMKGAGPAELGQAHIGPDELTPHGPSRGLLPIALYSNDPWSSACAHLRLVGPALHAGSGIQVLEGTRWGHEPPIAPPEKAQLIVIQRDFPRHRALYEQTLQWAHTAGIPIVYELDDLLTELPDSHPERSYYNEVRPLLLQAMRESEAVIVSTPGLAQYVRPHNENVWVLPNYLDDRLWELRKTLPEPAPQPIVIGYMGGITKTHLPDLALITPTLERLLQDYRSRIRLRFWGVLPPELEGRPDVEFVGRTFPDYTAFARYFSAQHCDVFIAPLCDNLFNRCKSPIKFLEYSALRIPGVYSRIPPYESMVVDGENGFLASAPEEWEARLRQLIEDQGLRRSMGKAALETVAGRMLISAHAHEWGETYRTVREMARSARSSAQACGTTNGIR